MAFLAFWLHKSSPPSLPLKRTYLVYINTKFGGEDNIIAEGKTHICAIHIGGPFAPPSFHCFIVNKTPAQAFTPPANEKKMGTIWIFVHYAVYGSGRGRCRDFLVLKWGGGLNLQIWDLNRAPETERTVFPILQVFSMCRCKL